MQLEHIYLREAHRAEADMAAKATTTIRQGMIYHPEHATWFAANQVLFNHVAAFYFEVIQAHEKILDLKEDEGAHLQIREVQGVERRDHHESSESLQ